MKQIEMLDLKREYEYMKRDVDAAMQRCLEHQRWIFGPEIKEFEDAVGGYVGVKHAIGVSSGTDALVLSLRAIAIQRKGEEHFSREDEIITTPFTFTATGDAILRAGATPVFVDIEPRTYNIDTTQIRKYIESALYSRSSKVIGIVPVHLYGQPADMDAIMELAKEYDLFVVEDVAQAFGAVWKNRRLGSLGNTGALSFFPSKNLGGFGDAGMVTTNDDEIAGLVRMLLKHGGKDKYNVDHIGYNSRLDTLQAAVLLAKFSYIDEFNERRRKVAELYTAGLQNVEGVVIPLSPALAPFAADSHVFHQYTVRTSRRDELQAFLKEKGVNTMVYYPFPLHKMRVFEGRMKIFGDLSNSERATEEVLSLPMEPLQKDETTMYVAECIKDFFGYGKI